jgi:signal transduction histidine kinase/ligand-binding sensor domain-containing protein
LAVARFLAGVLAICLAAATGEARADALGQPYFEAIAGTESIGNGIITIVAEDRRGLLWIGTPEGLYSYDGQRLRAFRNQVDDPGSIGDDYVRALLPHSDGTLWIATQGAGLSIYDARSDRFAHYRPRPSDPGALPSVATLALAEAANGDVWVGFGNRGLARWDHQSHQFEAFAPHPGQPGALQHEIVRCLLFDRRGDLWIGTGSGLQRRRVGATVFESVASDPAVADSLAGRYVYTLFEASDGRLWIGTQAHGTSVLDPASGRLQQVATSVDALSHPWVSGFVEPSPGTLWIHTYGAGIDVVDAATLTRGQRIRSDLSIPGGLPLDRLTAPYQDAAGLIWIGSWGAGLSKHNPHNVAAFSTLRHSPLQQRGLSTGSVLSTLPISARELFVGTGGNGIDVVDLDSGVATTHRPDARLPGALRDGTIRAMARAADGDVWVGTQQAGLQRYSMRTGTFSEPVAGLPSVPIRQLLLMRSGTLAIGTQAGLVFLDPVSGTISSLRLDAARAFTEPVWSLAEDAVGNLWISTPNVLLLRRPGADYPQLVDSPAVPLRALTDLKIDPAGGLWAIGPRGIALLTGWTAGVPQFEDFGRRLDASNVTLGQQVLPDRSGRLWSPRAMIDPRANQVESIGVADGVDIGSVEIGSGSIGPDGRLFFGGTRGLLIVEPERFVPWRYTPTVLLTAIDIDGRAQPLEHDNAGLQLLPGQRRLSVEFAALDYSAPGSLRYGYRLLGLDEEWIETDASQRVASYHNLWPGDYRLEVRARSRNGPWAPPLSLPVNVVPTWWQTPLALIVGVLGLLLLTLAAVRLRTRRMHRRALALERLVESRTRELSQAKEAAEGALVELKGAQRQLVAAEKMASLGQLVAGVAHEINTPVGIAITAASHLQDLAQEGNAKLAENRMSRGDLTRWKQEVEEAARLILQSLMRAGTLIASFKQVSVDQSSGQRRTFHLAEFLTEVQTTLQPSLRRTPHTLQIECAADIELDSHPGALFQILTNLVNNALMHAFDNERAGSMSIRAKVVGERLELSFKDDGRGMDDAVARHAFDPFFTTRRGSGGSGLGLHVVHNLVTQLLGGDIELITAPGKGTEFVIRVPLKSGS